MRFPLLIGLVSTVIAVPALAEAAPRRYRTYENRDRYDRYDDDYGDPHRTGLFLRGTAGVGGVTADDQLNDSTLSGGAGMFSLDLGGSITPRLALHGRLAMNSMFEPSVSSDGEYLGDLDDTSLGFMLLGGGLTYYFPSNWYVTGVAGLSRATFDFGGEDYDRLYGIGVMGDIGYEWPIGDELGLGVAGRLELHSVRDDAGSLSTAALGVLLSVSYF